MCANEREGPTIARVSPQRVRLYTATHCGYFNTRKSLLRTIILWLFVWVIYCRCVRVSHCAEGTGPELHRLFFSPSQASQGPAMFYFSRLGTMLDSRDQHTLRGTICKRASRTLDAPNKALLKKRRSSRRHLL